jgi:acyl-CoA thioesterase-1
MARRCPRRLIAVAAILAALGSVSSTSKAAPDTIPRIVVLGDSLTSGRGIARTRAFPALLQAQLIDDGYEYEVINSGVSGDTTARAVRRFRAALDGDVRVLIVALGANDGLRGVPVQQVTASLGQIIEEAQRRGISVLLCGMEALPVHGWAYSVAFHRAYDDLAARYRVPLVPFLLLKLIANPEMMQDDRIHPNEAGARVIADTIWPYLKPLLKRGQV